MFNNSVGILPGLAGKFDAGYIETHAITFLSHLPDRLQALHPSLSFAMLDLSGQRRWLWCPIDR